MAKTIHPGWYINLLRRHVRPDCNNTAPLRPFGMCLIHHASSDPYALWDDTFFFDTSDPHGHGDPNMHGFLTLILYCLIPGGC